ncbi:hypothetical protein NUU61_007378 [Penicillium alfredii]|uniref:Copper transport protein n=1 Tax=Penicillium alfredii TaxID=1506179 RepID=A0A9W9F2L4_9EURO|nr:uncharacterized protein NUU61_007378 [Penicillium alfredii]KAJ5092508.1 hypothetical protein NUU61_007378 [Penicillium alfredii]
MDHSMSPGSTGNMNSTSAGSMMVFTNAHDTPLFSSAWTPSSSGSYAGTCIFLIVLAMVDRGLIALKAVLERHWLAAHLNRRYVAITGKTSEAGRIDTDPDAKIASLVTAQGVEESVKVVRSLSHGPIPWRMLAVMTMNVGYFCSVLAGAFLGELGVGRYIWNEHGH